MSLRIGSADFLQQGTKRTNACILLVYDVINFRSSKFTKGDAFVGFQKDTPASVIFQATHLLRSACALAREGSGALKKHITSILKWSAEHSYTEEEETWKQAVSRESDF